MPAEPARFVLTLSCDDRRGIVAAVANCIAVAGRATSSRAPSTAIPRPNRFFMRVAFAAPAAVTAESFARALEPVASDIRFRLAAP